MTARAALSACAFFLPLGGPAGAAVMPDDIDITCALHHRTESDLNSLKKLPQSIRAYVSSAVGAMADRGEFFNATDVIERPAPSARFIRAGRSGNYWFLWYERGGIAYSKSIVLLRLDAELGVAAQKTYVRESPCALTDALLDQAR